MITRSPASDGMALLTTLLLVAIIGIITALALETMRSVTAAASNGRAAAQARLFTRAGEALLVDRLARLVETPAAISALIGKPQTLEIDGAAIRATVHDGGACFNLNALLTAGPGGQPVLSSVATGQFIALMTVLGIDSALATRIAQRTADWIDPDQDAAPDGAEDASYQRLDPGYRTPGRLMADVSELRAVAGVDAQTYARLRPWLCALPQAKPAPLAINSLTTDQWPLLAMLMPGRLTADSARQLIQSRPPNGWDNAAAFWQLPLLAAATPAAPVLDQVQLTPSFIRLQLALTQGDQMIRQTSLFALAGGKPVLIARTWLGEEP